MLLPEAISATVLRLLRRQKARSAARNDGCTVEKYKTKKSPERAIFLFGGAPTGIRTPVVALKGPRPRPLDDGGLF